MTDTDATGYTRIRVSWRDGVTHLELARPQRRNTIDLTTARELLDAALLERTAASRCVVLSGEGEHFCAGGDLKSFQAEADLPGHLMAVTTHLHAALARLAELPAPLVVAARGHTAGAGLGLACLGDVLLTEEGSTFRAAYGALGLTPDAGTSHRLPALVGLRRAHRMTHLGYVLDAKEAVEWGLATECLPAGRLDERVEEVAAQLAAGPTLAYGRTSRLLHAAAGRSLVEHLQDEAATLTRSATTADGREGVAAFTEHRAPAWLGR
jgi:2-(1,2-epoxy-1,2-dihydrophenyl)acetyl-CoA isomerase